MRSVADIFRSYEQLDSDGRHVGGTDKEGPNHSYGAAYEYIFDPFHNGGYAKNCCPPTPDGRRHCPKCQSDTSHWKHCPDFKHFISRNSVKLMMEIGVTDGSSMLAWREVFPNAHIVGMDVHHINPSNIRDRMEFHIGDQRSREDCERAIAGRQFDVIVEDATHILENTLQTLLFMYRHVRPGGLYIVEEWANIGCLRDHVRALWPDVEIVNSTGPRGECEPLVVFKKPTT